MANRGRAYSQPCWGDPMKEDYDNCHYEPQYEDDDASDFVHLDHCRLYITNIPKGLSEEGLRTAFIKYGTLNECYLSTDPQKRYGLVMYETAGEAKLAMMKLNRTDPLKLNICLAHKKTKRDNKKEDHHKGKGRDWSARNRDEGSSNGPRERGCRDEISQPRDRGSRGDVSQGNRQERDDSSVKSQSKRREELANGDIIMDNLPGDIDQDVNLETLDPDLQLELDRLQLEHIKLQQEQLKFKKRLLIKEAEKRAVNNNLPQPTRCLLPGGKVVVRNVDGSADPSNGDSSFTAGAGDCLKIPGLQRIQSRACVSCGAKAEEFCSRCGVTPYCSPRCQRRDWSGRHRDVCHNLARLSGNLSMDEPAMIEPVVPPAAPFRQPRSPAGNSNSKEFNKTQPRNQKEDSGSEKGHHKKFMPPGHTPPPHKSSNNNRGGRGGGARNFGNRRSQNDNTNGDEEWNIKPVQHDQKPSVSPIKAQSSPLVQANQAKSPANQVTSLVNQTTPTRNQTAPPMNQCTPPVGKAKPAAKPPASVDDFTLSRKLVPKNCIVDFLNQGDIAILSVEAADEDTGAWVCVSIHEKYSAQYDALLGDLAAACEAQSCTLQALNPALGEVFCLLNSEDGGWYRARRLSHTIAAFLDAGKISPIKESDKCSKLPAEFEATPEFCCMLNCDAAKIGQNLKCTLVSKTAKGFKASLEDCETGAAMAAELQRWRPIVQTPLSPTENATVQASPPAAQPTTSIQPTIPEVHRPDVTANSRVVLVDMTAFDKAYVRPVDAAVQKKFDLALEDVIMYGRTATPLKEPPHKGQVVVAKFSDGLHYRALVKRTNVKQNKYQLEYIEYGNIEVTYIENLYPCPPDMDLQHRPTMTSQVTLQVSAEHPFTPAALEFIESVKDTELVLTLPSGAKTAASGSAVVLTVAKSGLNLNKKLEEMCAPEWKKIEERGGDVIETEVLMYKDLEYVDLPADGCSLDVLDISTIESGAVNVCVKGLPHAAHVLGPLTQKMADYCNSEIGREPYLPKVEELCIAQCPPYPQWFRAVLLEQITGAGGQAAQVLYVDYGNVETVQVSLLRKMLPEFVRGLPALATTAKLKDFPENPTQAQLAKAIEHMQINDEGRGTIIASRCLKVEGEPGWCTVEAPALIAAVLAAK